MYYTNIKIKDALFQIFIFKEIYFLFLCKFIRILLRLYPHEYLDYALRNY